MLQSLLPVGRQRSASSLRFGALPSTWAARAQPEASGALARYRSGSTLR